MVVTIIAAIIMIMAIMVTNFQYTKVTSWAGYLACPFYLCKQIRHTFKILLS